MIKEWLGNSRPLTHFTHALERIITMPKILKNMLKKYKNYKLYAKTVDELSALSDKDLKDIGISRSEIKSVATRQYIRKAK